MDVGAERKLTPGDVRAERNRHLPPVSQQELADEVGWYQPYLSAIERNEFELSQDEYVKLLDAIGRIVARRKESAEEGRDEQGQ